MIHMSTSQSQFADGHVAQPNSSSILNDRPNPTEFGSSVQTANLPSSTWVDRLKSYFLTNEGRIGLASLICTLICVVLQHAMGTCVHVVSDHTKDVKWHVFTPPCRLMIFLHDVSWDLVLEFLSWSRPSHCGLLLCSFVDNTRLLHSAYLGVRHHRCSIIEKTRSARSRRDRRAVSRRLRFQYLG